MIDLKGKKIALVHDFLIQYGGAERVLEALCEMFPDAPVYTLLADQRMVQEHFPGRDIRQSSLARFPRFFRNRYRLLLPFLPSAAEALDLREFDIVISSSGAWSKGIVTRLDTYHIAYIHSPMRYAWDYHKQYIHELALRGKRKLVARLLLSYLRIWDREAALRPDCLLANSKYTAKRIEKYYRRDATVVYPAALRLFEKFGRKDVSKSAKKREYFLVVSRLTRSKKVDIV
ncbi:MAG: glycosyltransferase, partial [Patescibacteria group bacterium]